MNEAGCGDPRDMPATRSTAHPGRCTSRATALRSVKPMTRPAVVTATMAVRLRYPLIQPRSLLRMPGSRGVQAKPRRAHGHHSQGVSGQVWAWSVTSSTTLVTLPEAESSWPTRPGLNGTRTWPVIRRRSRRGRNRCAARRWPPGPAAGTPSPRADGSCWPARRGSGLTPHDPCNSAQPLIRPVSRVSARTARESRKAAGDAEAVAAASQLMAGLVKRRTRS